MRRHCVAVLVACVSLAGASESALSDGAPYEYSTPASYPAARYGWTGFYLGAHLGGTWGSSTANGETGATLDDSWSYSPSGLVVGGTLGYNWQLGPMIYGIEGDLGNLGLAGSGGYYVPFGYDASTSTDAGFYMTLRGRLGFLMNGWMLYATAGYLGADTTVSVLEACDIFCSVPTVSAESSGFRNGWTIGAGFEVALEGAWSVKAEYNHLDFGRNTETLNPQPGCDCNSFQYDVRQTVDLVKVGLNYRFGWAGPIVAKY